MHKVYIADEYRYELRKGIFTGSSVMKEVNYANGQIKEQGNYANDKDGHLSNLKVGEWISYYENGQLKSKGKYNIGTYIQCCFTGSCKEFYNYKVGYWEYFYPNGVPKATGAYESTQLHIETSCEGGDDMTFGLATVQWKYFNEQGEIIEPANELIVELETVKTGGDAMVTYFVPDSKKENIVGLDK